MNYSLDQDARAVLLPAFDSLDFADVMGPFLDQGGHSLLIGETRDEYVARTMFETRLSTETASIFRSALERLLAKCPKLIVAVDEEMGGIQRLQGLVPPLPALAEAIALSHHDLTDRCFRTASAARELGVTMFLAPIADVAGRQNPWLRNRQMGTDPATVAKLVKAFVTGVQKAGVSAVTKHFPGYDNLVADPALVDVALHTPLEQILRNALPFQAAVEAGTRAVMTGPAPVVAVDAENAASTSPAVIALLRQQFGFQGLVVSDDLDAPATMRGRSLVATAVASLNAGADLLLFSGGPHLGELCEGIAAAARAGTVSTERLSDAAKRVRQHAALL